MFGWLQEAPSDIQLQFKVAAWGCRAWGDGGVAGEGLVDRKTQASLNEAKHLPHDAMVGGCVFYETRFTV